MSAEQVAKVDVTTMKNVLCPAEIFAMDEDFLLCEIRLDGSHDPCRFNFGGMIFFICLEGTALLNLNSDKDIVLESSFATASPPACPVRLGLPEKEGGPDGAVLLFLAVSQKYYFDLKIDMGEMFNHLKNDKIRLFISNPTLCISDELLGLLKGHVRLIRETYASGIHCKKTHYTLLLSSMLNVVNVAFNHDDNILRQQTGQLSRSKSVFSDFMKLAVENFETERGIRFYADKLCLTPKYLSKLIKEGCGSSASTIIDNLVTAKAKNLLKHTDYSVKLVAARLHFSSQSSFNKFFKAKTGMSPLKFRSQ